MQIESENKKKGVDRLILKISEKKLVWTGGKAPKNPPWRVFGTLHKWARNRPKVARWWQTRPPYSPDTQDSKICRVGHLPATL